jgi:anaerobic ribonucleoside-triphosphate reductase
LWKIKDKKEREEKNMEKIVGEGMKFERIRRVTGYLSGDVSRFNNGKRAEEKDRVKHSGIKEVMQEEKCAA